MLQYVTVYMIYVIVDCVQVTISGNLRGMGKQVLRCINFFFSFFFFFFFFFLFFFRVRIALGTYKLGIH